jgi:hypothetical protein
MSIASEKIPKHLYHLSDENHNNEVFYPRVPKTITYNEDVKTKRICFSSSMSSAFRAHFNYKTGWIIKYVHIPIRPVNYPQTKDLWASDFIADCLLEGLASAPSV